MCIQKSLDEMKKIQTLLLTFLDSEDNVEENFLNVNNFITDLKICDDQHKLKLILHLFVKIGNNHQRASNFFDKMFRILLIFKKSIKNFFSNSEIFHIFKSNKRILLFLIEEKIMEMDENIVKQIVTNKKYIDEKYPEYFSPEIKQFSSKSWFPKLTPDFRSEDWIIEINKEIPENFYENRRIGENHTPICKLIREKLVKDFISYVNKNNISLESTIEPSIYETNSFLLKQMRSKIDNNDDNYHYYNNDDDENSITLIEYASFFGSLEIFNYLKSNDVILTPSLWLYTIHGQNAELIHLIEDNHIKPDDDSYQTYFNEAIKCHNNEVANYYLNNFLQTNKGANLRYLKYYNFIFLEENCINESSLNNLCYYDYYLFVDILLKNGNIDINERRKIGDDEITALYSAIEKGNIEIVKLLLSHDKIDVNIMNKKEKKIVKTFYWGDGNEIITYNETALFLAVEKKNVEIVKILLENDKLDINKFSNKYLKEDGKKEEYGKIEEYEKTALYLAVEKQNAEIIRLLIENDKIDLNIVNRNYKSYVEKTFGYEDESRYTAFYAAVAEKNTKIIKLFLENDKLDPNILNKYITKDLEMENYYHNENTALYLAIDQKNNYEIVKLLLTNKKIDLNILNKVYIGRLLENSLNHWKWDRKQEKTALYRAVEKNDLKQVNLLLTNENLDLNVLNKSWQRKIDYEWKEEDEEEEEEEEEKDEEDEILTNTALHLAVKNQNIQIIELLMKHKSIDINATDSEGKKPIDYAINDKIKGIFSK